MANSISTNDKLINLGAAIGAATPVLSKLKHDISDKYMEGDGDTVRVEVVSYPVISDGATSTTEDINIKGVDVRVDMFNSKLSLSAIEKAMDIEDFNRQISEPTGVAVAAKIEKKVVKEALDNACFATVSTGTFPQLSDLNAKIRDTKLGGELIGFTSNVFNSTVRNSSTSNQFGPSVGERLYKGEIGVYDNCEYFATSDITALTISNLPVAGTSTVTANVTADGATTITIGGLASATGVVKRGTLFGLTGVNNVNLLGEDIGVQRVFVVTEDVTAVGSAATVKVAPIYFKAASGKSDPRQNVSVTSIASGTVVNYVPQTAGVYTYAVVFDPNVMVWSSKPLRKYEDQGSASESKMVGEGSNKIAVRLGRFSSSANGGQEIRFDGDFGVKAIMGKGIGVSMIKIA